MQHSGAAGAPAGLSPEPPWNSYAPMSTAGSTPLLAVAEMSTLPFPSRSVSGAMHPFAAVDCRGARLEVKVRGRHERRIRVQVPSPLCTPPSTMLYVTVGEEELLWISGPAMPVESSQKMQLVTVGEE